MANDANAYLADLSTEVRPVAEFVHAFLVSRGCQPYVKTIYIGYELNGQMVAATYGHLSHIEVAMALPEEHPDPQLHDATHLSWRTMPLAASASTVVQAEALRPLLGQAVDAVAAGEHSVDRDPDFFYQRKQERRARQI